MTTSPNSTAFPAGKDRPSEKYFTLQVLVPLEVVVCIRGNVKKYLANDYGVSHLCPMPSQPSPDKQMLSVRIKRAEYLRLVKQARRNKMDLADFVRHLIQKATEDIELTPEDYEKIAADIRAYINRQTRQGNRSAARKDGTK